MNNELNEMNQFESNGENQWKSKNEFNQALYYLKRWVIIDLYPISIYHIKIFEYILFVDERGSKEFRRHGTGP